MKEISELVTPHDIGYTRDHEWARLDGKVIRKRGPGCAARLAGGLSRSRLAVPPPRRMLEMILEKGLTNERYQ